MIVQPLFVVGSKEPSCKKFMGDTATNANQSALGRVELDEKFRSILALNFLPITSLLDTFLNAREHSSVGANWAFDGNPVIQKLEI